ncbi:MAG: hypothetical protein M1836_007947 [Candelina mexicana]|nr:MAG: hypothetical protein M1836_007947 [Candelina mexicana]
MSRPYQNSFDSIQSPLNRQQPANFASPTSASAAGQPPSFKTNVNRAKTKRWVEAKSVSYDGDDWGDEDEYDEYGGYDEPPAPPKPTGYRQQGQVPTTSPLQTSNSHGGFGTPSMPQPGTVFNDHRRRYGDLPGQGPRVMSNPQPAGGTGRERSNSFDKGDEKRAFSAGGYQSAPGPKFTHQSGYVESPTTQSGHGPATRFSQMGIGASSPDPATSKDLPPIPSIPEDSPSREPSPRQPGRGAPPLQVQTQSIGPSHPHPAQDLISPVSTSSANYRGADYSQNQRRTSSASRTRSIDSSTASDFQARRDFSPTALPPPLQTRASPAPPFSELSSPGQFPPRKSSLSQKNSSYAAPDYHASPGGFITQTPPSALSRRESGSSTGRNRAGSSSGISQPFVRPADIYKRVEEERQKERQSSESGRPSMDSIMRRTSEHDFALSSGDTMEEPSSDKLRRGLIRRPSREDSEEIDSNRKLKPMLDPVTERRSEYGLDGLLVDARGDTAGQIEEPTVAHAKLPQAFESPSIDTHSSTPDNSQVDEKSRTPSLPQVSRVSGFGDDFWSSDQHSARPSELTPQVPPPANSFHIDGGHSLPGTGEPTLNHQESQGFRSAVRQAFHRQDDRSVPPTPSSISGSQRSHDGSGVSRADSHSTAGISPIMSRVPSAATALSRSKEAEAREAATPAIAEEPTTPETIPKTASTLSTPRDRSRKPSPSPNRNLPTENRQPVFMPGHRRNQSTPSPRGSPARSPALGVSHQIAEGELAEIVQASPTDTRPPEHGSNSVAPSIDKAHNRGRSLDYTTREVDVATEVKSNPYVGASDTASSVTNAQNLFLDTRVDRNRASRSSTPVSRADSPSKGKVRDLAGRFESNQSPVSASPTRGPAQPSSSKGSPASSLASRSQDLTAPRPATERMQTFRPALPGGWVSYATTNGPTDPGPEGYRSVAEVEDRGQPSASAEKDSPTTPIKLPDTSKEDLDITPTTAPRTLVGSEQQPAQHEDPSKGAFAAVAAAGAAMAEAITAAVGLESEPSKENAKSDAKFPASDGSIPSEESDSHVSHNHDSSGDPQAYGPQRVDVVSGSAESATPSKSPTTPPNDTPLLPASHPASEYFSPTVPLNYGHMDGRSDVSMPPITTRPQMLPTLSTETSPNDQESDRLRKEIVRTLSPTSTNLDHAPGFPTDLQKTSSIPTGANDSRGSTLFPSEYESYWASAGEDDWAGQQHQLPQVQEEQYTNPAHQVPELSRHQEQTSLEGSTRDHDVQGTDTATQPQGHSRGLSEASHDAELSQLLGTRNAYFDQAQGREIRKEHNTGPLHVINSDREDFLTQEPAAKHDVETSPNRSIDGLHPVEREPASVTEQYDNPAVRSFEEGLELADGNEGASDPANRSWGTRSGDVEQKVYTGQGKDNVLQERSAWAGASVERGVSEEAKKSLKSISSDDHASPLAAVPSVPFDRPDESQNQTQVAPHQPKVPTFREIGARKSPIDRIRGYNSAREHIAKTDTGLSHWLAITASQNPDLLPLSARPNTSTANSVGSNTSPTQASFSKGSPTNLQHPQQPYYQQYLSAQSSTGTGPPPPAKGSYSTPISGMSQGFSGSGSGKLSSREVQAKGKDLLHSAGIFGGKANVAAKGLFAKGRSRFKGSGGDKTPPSPVSPISASPDETRDLPQELQDHSSNSLQDQHSSASPLTSAALSLNNPLSSHSNEVYHSPVEADDGAEGNRAVPPSTDDDAQPQSTPLLPHGPTPSDSDQLKELSDEPERAPNLDTQGDQNAHAGEQSRDDLSHSQGIPQLPALRFSSTDTFGHISAFVSSSSHAKHEMEERHGRRDLAAEMLSGEVITEETIEAHPLEESWVTGPESVEPKTRMSPQYVNTYDKFKKPVSERDASTLQNAVGPPKLSIVTQNEIDRQPVSGGSREMSPSLEIIGSTQPEPAVQSSEGELKGVIDSPLPKYEGPEVSIQSPEKPPRYSFEDDSPVLSTPPLIQSPIQPRTSVTGPPAHRDEQVSPDLEPSSPMHLPAVINPVQPRRRRSPSPEVSPERREEKNTVTQGQAGDQSPPVMVQSGIRRQSNARSRNSVEQRPFSFLPHSPGPEELPRQDIITRDLSRRAQQKRAPSPIEERLSTHSRDRTSISQPSSIQEPSSPRHRSKDMPGQSSSEKIQSSASQRSSIHDHNLSPPPTTTDPYGPPSPALRSKYYTAHNPSRVEEEQYFPHPQSPDGPPIHEHPAFKQTTPPPSDDQHKQDRSPQRPKVDTRPQTSEYQLPAVTPPTPEISSPKPKRTSGRFKGFGSATSDPEKPLSPILPSTERATMERPPIDRPPTEKPPAQWTAVAERAAQRDTSLHPPSPAGPDRKKPKRSSFLSNLTKPTTTNQEPKVTPDLRADLLQRSLQSTPQPTEPIPPKKQQSLPLSSLPGLKGSKGDKKASKGILQRSSTSADSDSHDGKKKRFSGFGSLFGRSHGTTGHARNEKRPIPAAKKSRSPLGLTRIPFPLQQQPQPDPREQFPYQQAYITKRLPTHHEEVYQATPPGGYYAPPNQSHQYERPQEPASYRQYSNESGASRERSAYAAHADYMRGNPASQRQSPSRTPGQYVQLYGPNPTPHPRTAPLTRPIPHLSPEVSGESQYQPLSTSTSSPGPPVSPVLSMRSQSQPAHSPHYQPPQPHLQYQQYTHPAPYSSPHLYHSTSYSSHHSQQHSPDVYSAPPPRAHEYPYPRPPPSSVPTVSNPPPFDRGNTSPARERMHEQQTPWTLSIPGVDGMMVTPHASLIPARKEGVRTGGVDDMPSYREAQWRISNDAGEEGKLRPKSLEHTTGGAKAPTPPPKIPIGIPKGDVGKDDVPAILDMERDVLKGEGVRREASGRDLKEVDTRGVRDEKEVNEGDEDGEIVMSSTAYPGQEWMPWVGDID